MVNQVNTKPPGLFERILFRLGLIPVDIYLDAWAKYSNSERDAESYKLALEQLRKEHRDLRAETKSRFQQIAALETPRCARVGKNMARIARASIDHIEFPGVAAPKESG